MLFNKIILFHGYCSKSYGKKITSTSAIATKYGEEWGGWTSGLVRGVLMGAACGGWSNFQHFASFDVGDGLRLQFWHDVWHGSQSLKELYPALFACSLDQSALVHSIQDCQVEGDGRFCNMRFHRGFHD